MNSPLPVLTPYAESLGMTNEERRNKMLPAKTEETKKTVELGIAKLQTELINLGTRVQSATASYPIDLDATMNAIDAYQLAARRIKILEQVKDTLFPG